MRFADPHGLTKRRNYRDPLRKILEQGRSHWNHNGIRQDARRAFERAVQCRTAALGAEVYASNKSERIVYHTCKSRACPSCGHRATIQWQRERWTALPGVPYKGITFTMPKDLWSVFQQNRNLADALPALAAGIMESVMRAKHGIRIGVITILHTFNGRLEFNSHVHTMVTAGGLHEQSGAWISSAFYNRDQLTRLWRIAVIRLIRTAYRAGLLRTDMTCAELRGMLTFWEDRWWSVNIQSFANLEHFLRYAGRYVRRPSLAQRRITRIGTDSVTFWVKDKKQRRIIEARYSLREFIDLWTQHLPGRYKHAMRHFGIFAPRAVSQISAAIFAMTGQLRKPKPKPLRWADSIKRDFGWDPLLDKKRNRMHWVRRLPPLLAVPCNTV